MFHIPFTYILGFLITISSCIMILNTEQQEEKDNSVVTSQENKFENKLNNNQFFTKSLSNELVEEKQSSTTKTFLQTRDIKDFNNLESAVGTNLNHINDWSSEISFIDAFKTSRPWITQCQEGEQADCSSANAWNTKEADQLDLDEHGWVRSLPAPTDKPTYWFVGTLLFTTLNGHYPAGQYIVLYDGEGTIEYDFSAKKNQEASRPGRDVINVTPNEDPIYIKITATDPNKTGNYIRNIRVILPNHESMYQQNQVFYPKFLDQIKNFTVLRFMNWMHTNGSTEEKWQQRTTMAHARWGGNGKSAPVELMVKLSNLNNSDPWFNMPHKVNDEYIRNFANLVKTNLSPNLKVYVEYSNEVWNSMFDQGYWVEEQALKEWDQAYPDVDPYTKRLNWFGKRTAQICDIWKQVWAENPERVICVMASQASNEWSITEILNCPLWKQEAPCYAHGINAVAIAPYFGYYLGLPEHEQEVTAWTKEADGGLNKLFQELQHGGVLNNGASGGALQDSANHINDSVKITNQMGLDLIAYEGGQHLVGVDNVVNNQLITQLFINANRDPRMETLYTEYLNIWKAKGGKLFTHYTNCRTASKWGSWGTLEYMDQVSSPKYDALLKFIGENTKSILKSQSFNNNFKSLAPISDASVKKPTTELSTSSMLWYTLTAYDIKPLNLANNENSLYFLEKLQGTLETFAQGENYNKALAAALFANATRLSAVYDVNLAADYLNRAEQAWLNSVSENDDIKLWAAAELYRVTGDLSYQQYFEQRWSQNISQTEFYKRAIWAYYQTNWKNVNSQIQVAISEQILQEADQFLVESSEQTSIETEFDKTFTLLQAWAISDNGSYRDIALSSLQTIVQPYLLSL
jgi:hypothetical protein